MRKRIAIAAVIVAAGAGAAGCSRFERDGMNVTAGNVIEGWHEVGLLDSGTACAWFHSSDADAVGLPSRAVVIYNNAEDGQDLGVRSAAKALLDEANKSPVGELPAGLVSSMRTACYVYESSPVGLADGIALADRIAHPYEVP